MNCPACKSGDCRRSRRRTFLDHLLGVIGVVPWRCKSCETRFHARAIPLRYIWYARCNQCGNLDLQRISPDKVLGVAAGVGRWLRLPALRCEPCRNKFFALRPALRMEAAAPVRAQNTAGKY